MLKVTMIIDNLYAIPEKPIQYVMRKVLRVGGDDFKIVDIKVEQEAEFEKLTSYNKDYVVALRVFEEFSKSDDNDFRVTSFYMWINKRLNSQK